MIMLVSLIVAILLEGFLLPQFFTWPTSLFNGSTLCTCTDYFPQLPGLGHQCWSRATVVTIPKLLCVHGRQHCVEESYPTIIHDREHSV